MVFRVRFKRKEGERGRRRSSLYFGELSTKQKSGVKKVAKKRDTKKVKEGNFRNPAAKTVDEKRRRLKVFFSFSIQKTMARARDFPNIN